MRLNQQRVFEILSKHNGDDPASKLCDRLLAMMIILNLFAILLESVPEIGASFANAFLLFEIISVGIFTVEYSLRIWSAAANTAKPDRTSWQMRRDYIFSFTGVIDLLSILPSLLSAFVGPLDLRWVRVLRLVRLLKFSHYSPALEDLTTAVKEEKRSFSAALYLFLIALFTSSALMYIAENPSQPDVFSSIPETMWWSIITLTTVGYGDVSPVTPLGKIIGAFTALMGVCVVALLTAIVATAFANQTSDRKEMLEAEISLALSDGIITAIELRKIRKLQKELNLSDDYVEALIQVMKEKRR